MGQIWKTKSLRKYFCFLIIFQSTVKTNWHLAPQGQDYNNTILQQCEKALLPWQLVFVRGFIPSDNPWRQAGLHGKLYTSICNEVSLWNFFIPYYSFSGNQPMCSLPLSLLDYRLGPPKADFLKKKKIKNPELPKSPHSLWGWKFISLQLIHKWVHLDNFANIILIAYTAFFTAGRHNGELSYQSRKVH